MFPDDFFHPDHVVPAVQFIAAVFEGTTEVEAEMFVELGTVFVEIFVLYFGVADAGIKIQNAHGFQAVGEGFVEFSAETAFFCVIVEVDREFTGPIVGSAANEGTCIGVAFDFSVSLDHEIWIFFHGVAHPVFEFFERGDFVFECDHGVFDIISIDFQDARCIFKFCISDIDGIHGDLLFEKTAVTGVIIAPEKGDENRCFVAERYPAIIVGKRFYPVSLVNDQLRRLDDPPAK